MFTAADRAEAVALACALPAESGVPLSKWSCLELARELATRRQIPVSASTIRRWLASDALKPWQHRSWISVRDPAFAAKAARLLDLYAGIWDGAPLGSNDYVICAAREPQLRAVGLDVRADLAGPVAVCADPDRIHQVIGNLLANAARYCRPGDVVTVRASAAGPDAVIEVADTGPGIDDADLPHVFDRLWRGRAADGVVGRGIGLAVVRGIVTAHGGTVTAASGPGGGAVFTIRLPQQDRPRAA